MPTQTPSVQETGIAICDQIQVIGRDQDVEAEALLIRRVFPDYLDGDIAGIEAVEAQTTFTEEVRRMAQDAIERAIAEDNVHLIHREYFYGVFEVPPVFSPNDTPIEVSPSTMPFDDPGQPPLFAAS